MSNIKNQKKAKIIPLKWKNCTAMGKQVPGTRFVPFKTPLKEEICKRYLKQEAHFTPKDLLEQQPDIKLIFNLTNSENGRFYNFWDFGVKGVKVVSIPVLGGGRVPRQSLLDKFFSLVSTFVKEEDPKSLIGVHCSDGINRTGYFICKYMKQCLGICGKDAMETFQDARGTKMNRKYLIKDILKR